MAFGHPWSWGLVMIDRELLGGPVGTKRIVEPCCWSAVKLQKSDYQLFLIKALFSTSADFD